MPPETDTNPGLNFIWKDTHTGIPEDISRELAARIDLSLPLARLLVARGYGNPQVANTFLNPLQQKLSDPTAIPNLRLAAQRLQRAIADKESVVVYGDFDADGVVAAALMVDLIRFCGGQVRHFLPDRHSEGYGLTPQAIQRCLAQGKPDLLITVDCGMAADEQLAFLHDQGIALIITDHHHITGDFPVDSIVFNPLQPDVPAAMRNLCGAGVAFQFAHALVKERGDIPHERERLAGWLAAVAVATVADVVPLEGDNRTLVAHGLHILNRRPGPGLVKLMQRGGISATDIDSYHLGFVLGPRINAAGRMDSAESAFELLSTDCPDTAAMLAKRLDDFNSLRKNTEQKILQEARRQLDDWLEPDLHGAVVVGSPGWHSGVVGIVAARLMEHYNRPAAVVSLDEKGGGRGSLRAGCGYHAVNALNACREHLERWGGHEFAAGFSIKPGHFDPFREAFAAACFGQVQAVSRLPELSIDGWLDRRDIGFDLLEGMKRLAPFGESNPLPCWGLKGATLRAAPREIGADKTHLRLDLRTSDDLFIEAVWFGGATHRPRLVAHEGAFDVAGEITENNWQGQSTLQMIVRDIRLL